MFQAYQKKMPSDGSEFLFEKTLWGIKWLDQKLGGGFWEITHLKKSQNCVKFM